MTESTVFCWWNPESTQPPTQTFVGVRHAFLPDEPLRTSAWEARIQDCHGFPSYGDEKVNSHSLDEVLRSC